MRRNRTNVCIEYHQVRNERASLLYNINRVISRMTKLRGRSMIQKKEMKNESEKKGKELKMKQQRDDRDIGILSKMTIFSQTFF